MTTTLKKRCLFCNELLKASEHKSKKEANRRNKNKKFCGTACSNRYREHSFMSSAEYTNFINGVGGCEPSSGGVITCESMRQMMNDIINKPVSARLSA